MENLDITTSRDMDGVSLSKESYRFVEKEREALTFYVISKEALTLQSF